ncbi:MAG: hypothetical protein V4556_13770 [Bacteroidota bacterium]
MLLLSLSIGILKAQYQRAEQLPSVYGELFTGGSERIALDSNENMYFRYKMVNFQNKSVYTKPEFYNSGQSGRESREIYSPNHRYKVITYYNAWDYSKKGGRKLPKADWLTYTMAIDWEKNSSNGQPFTYMTHEYYDENFTLAITSEGKLITTDPGKITEWRGFLNAPSIKHINGLYLFDPHDGSRKTITTDKIDARDAFIRYDFLSDDESSIVLVLNNRRSSGKASEVVSYNISTGAKTRFTSSESFLAVMAGNSILVNHDFSKKPGFSYELTILRLNDGKSLASMDVVNSEDLLRYDLRGDTLFYYNPDNYTIATFIPGKEDMQLHSLIPVDTTNLGFAPVPYNLTVLKDKFALMPAKMPDQHWERREYSGYAILFDRKNAMPLFAVKPFFVDPKTAIAARNAANQQYHKNCEELKRKTPYVYGTILRPKTGSLGQAVIFMGADCRTDNYLIRTPGGTSLGGLYDYQLKERYDALGPEYKICGACSGAGTITESFTVADDKWEQVNFNIYVRNKNATKTETITSKCKKCAGQGFYKN